MKDKVRQPNSITVVGFRDGFAGNFKMHPYNFDVSDAKKLREWLDRVIIFLENQENLDRYRANRKK